MIARRRKPLVVSGKTVQLDAPGRNVYAIFQGPRLVMLERVLARHEIEAAVSIMKPGWWDPDQTFV